jgi:hypothetical protein
VDFFGQTTAFARCTLTKKARKITAAQYTGKTDTFYFNAEPGRVRHDFP